MCDQYITTEWMIFHVGKHANVNAINNTFKHDKHNLTDIKVRTINNYFVLVNCQLSCLIVTLC